MLRVRDIMSTDVITVSPEMTIRDTMDLFAANHVSGAPVVSGRNVLGVVTATDLMTFASSLPGAPTFREDAQDWGEWETQEADIEEQVEEGAEPAAAFWTMLWEDAGVDSAVRMSTHEGPEWSVLDEHTVEEAMTPAVYSLPPDATVTEAADYMQRHNVHRVLVMKGRELLGIVTTTDVARAVAEHRLSERRFVFGQPQVREDGSWW
ncbi:MAG TPA: CBS domain-containing protein [Gemmatimonadaceae bacterium]